MFTSTGSVPNVHEARWSWSEWLPIWELSPSGKHAHWPEEGIQDGSPLGGAVQCTASEKHSHYCDPQNGALTFSKGPWGALYTFPSWKPLLSNHYLLGGKPFWNPIIFVFLLNQHTPWDMIPNVNCDCLSGGNWRMETQTCLSVFSLWALLEDFFTYFLNHFLNPWLDPINFHNLISKQITSKK